MTVTTNEVKEGRKKPAKGVFKFYDLEGNFIANVIAESGKAAIRVYEINFRGPYRMRYALN